MPPRCCGSHASKAAPAAFFYTCFGYTEKVRTPEHIPNPHLRPVQGILLLALAGLCAVLAHHFWQARPNATPLHTSSVQQPQAAVLATLPPAQLGDTIYIAELVQQHNREQAQKLDATLQKIQATVQRGTALDDITARLYAGNLSGSNPQSLTAPAATLMRAGLLTQTSDYTPITPSNAPLPDAPTFSKQILREIIREEVDSFLHKVWLVNEVGKYLKARSQTAE